MGDDEVNLITMLLQRIKAVAHFKAAWDFLLPPCIAINSIIFIMGFCTSHDPKGLPVNGVIFTTFQMKNVILNCLKNVICIWVRIDKSTVPLHHRLFFPKGMIIMITVSKENGKRTLR